MKYWVVTFRVSRDPTVESRVVWAKDREAAAEEVRRRYDGRVRILSVHEMQEQQ